MTECYLVSLDNKGKLRVFHTDYFWSDDSHGYIINRYSGVYLGKEVQGPSILVTSGKAKRTILEQTQLQWNHLIKEKLDKGYKKLDKPVTEYSESELREIVGSVVTNTNDIPKPMLAKQADKVTNQKIYDKEWYASRKIDGLRILIYMVDGKLHTASRGAMNYDPAMIEILENEKLVNLFNNHPGLILDGEGYHHHYSLQQLNSIARTQKTVTDLSVLQFYWYDIVDTTKPFKERYEYMLSLKEELNLHEFDPEYQFEDDELRIQFVPQIKISGWDNMLKLHNNYVEEGWEGLVIRDPSKVYKPNGRTNDMIKIKLYKSSDFLVIDYELGMRGSEDMVFICQMEDGKTFKAKPLGDRLQKEEYVNNFDKYYKNHIGECKYFYFSDDGVPLQPAFKAFRDDLNK